MCLGLRLSPRDVYCIQQAQARDILRARLAVTWAWQQWHPQRFISIHKQLGHILLLSVGKCGVPLCTRGRRGHVKGLGRRKEAGRLVLSAWSPGYQERGGRQRLESWLLCRKWLGLNSCCSLLSKFLKCMDRSRESGLSRQEMQVACRRKGGRDGGRQPGLGAGLKASSAARAVG